jgi:hypothetical protein
MEGVDMDLEYANKRLMAALVGIAAGKTHEHFVTVPGFGQSSKIFDALNDAAKYLDEEFQLEELTVVDRAMRKLKLVRPSTRKDEVAKAILNALIK